ncbi:MAG: zf-HC2 domain-containing protein [Thermoanaerobaculia bacterium]|nr:zf-HC2 domain-containing protein [Thermoanaerobaculia bacterium]
MRPALDSDHPDDSELEALFWGELSESRESEVRTHLGGCPACQEALADLEEFSAISGPPEDPEERAAGRRLAASILKRARHLEQWRKVALALAMSLFVVAVGSVIYFALRDGKPQGTVLRAELVDGTVRGRTRIEIDARARTIELALISKSLASELRYEVTIQDVSGRLRFSAKELEAADKVLLIELPRTTLEPGGDFELAVTSGAEAAKVEIVRFGFEAIFR